MPKLSVGLAFTYLFFLLGSVVAIYMIFLHPLMKDSYDMVTNKMIPNFITSLIQKHSGKESPEVANNE